jgi:NhaA family Na+:H+ antiporter
MVIPAIIYATINGGTSTAAGWAIPTATDIAFAVGILNILGNRIPVAIKVFIAALAVVDDLGAVVVIAIFYSDNVSLFFLILLIILIPIFKLLLKKTRVFFYIIYLFVGVTLFFLLQKANLHTTLSGVLLAAITPYSKQPKQSYLNKVEHLLHKPVNYIIIPAFAIINTAIVLAPSTISNFNLKLFLGVFLGLVIGKPTGITLFSYLACKLKIAELPPSITIKKLFITSILGGIGFTMSIFISLLAFSNHNLIEQSKLAILIASGCAGIVGFVALKIMFKIRV